jgi:hypothetical protein
VLRGLHYDIFGVYAFIASIEELEVNWRNLEEIDLDVTELLSRYLLERLSKTTIKPENISRGGRL